MNGLRRGAVAAAWVVALIGVSDAARQAAPAVTGSTAAVPAGDGTPVVTDGIFSPGEWDDAAAASLSPSVELRAKHFRGVAFVGLRAVAGASIGPSDLWLAVPGGPIHQLHVSAQLGEIVLPPAGDAPPFRFGYTTGWYANEFRRDMQESERLQKEGRPPMEIIAATSYPCDGIEFAIRRSKFPGDRWLVRLGVSVIAAGKPGWLAFPAGAADRSTKGWLELRFE